MYKSKNLGHLGLVSGMCDDLGIVSLIDQWLPCESECRKISTGQCVKAFILNGLGFVERRLYLFSDFFSDKPVEHLLGAGVTEEMLNDDRLGRCLDDLYSFGVSELFSLIAQKAYQHLNLSAQPRFYHLDSTSFHVDGTYNSDTYREGDACIHLTQGYSRDHRAELNQACLNLIVENLTGLPLYIKALSGNSNDKKTFVASIEQFTSSLQFAPTPMCWVADSALYSAENICRLAQTGLWLTRVPETIAEVSSLKAQADRQTMACFEEERLSDYRYQQVESNYGGVQQEWLLIFSHQAYERELKSLNKSFLKHSLAESKQITKLCNQLFSCEKDAQKAIEALKKKCLHTHFIQTEVHAIEGYALRGKPKKDSPKIVKGYRVEIVYACEMDKYKQKKEQLGYFVLASNATEGQLSPSEKLLGYKDQSKVERGFRFLKDPSFHASTMFVKKPERVESVLMIMTLSLLVYAALEMKLRESLVKNKDTLPNQSKKEIQNPTMKWVFILLKGIHCLYIEQKDDFILLNMNETHEKIIFSFSQNVRKYYKLE